MGTKQAKRGDHQHPTWLPPLAAAPSRFPTRSHPLELTAASKFCLPAPSASSRLPRPRSPNRPPSEITRSFSPPSPSSTLPHRPTLTDPRRPLHIHPASHHAEGPTSVCDGTRRRASLSVTHCFLPPSQPCPTPVSPTFSTKPLRVDLCSLRHEMGGGELLVRSGKRGESCWSS